MWRRNVYMIYENVTVIMGNLKKSPINSDLFFSVFFFSFATWNWNENDQALFSFTRLNAKNKIHENGSWTEFHFVYFLHSVSFSVSLFYTVTDWSCDQVRLYAFLISLSLWTSLRLQLFCVKKNFCAECGWLEVVTETSRTLFSQLYCKCNVNEPCVGNVKQFFSLFCFLV